MGLGLGEISFNTFGNTAHPSRNPNTNFLLGSNHQLQHQTIQENQQNEDLEPRVTFFLIVEPKAYAVNQNDTVFFIN